MVKPGRLDLARRRFRNGGHIIFVPRCGKIIQWIGGNDLEKTAASIIAVDSISFTMSFSGAMDAGSHYLIGVSAEE